MEHTLAQSFELLSSILRCKANTVEYKNIKGQLNQSELDALKQLQSKQYLATQKAKQQTATRSQQTPHHEHALTPMAPQSAGSCNGSITDVDDRATSTQFFDISQDRLPMTTVGDETLPTNDLRSTEHDVDKETMRDVLTQYAHAIAGAAAEVSNHPTCKDREFHLDLQFAKFENAMDFATNHGLTDNGARAEGAERKRRRKKKRH